VRWKVPAGGACCSNAAAKKVLCWFCTAQAHCRSGADDPLLHCSCKQCVLCVCMYASLTFEAHSTAWSEQQAMTLPNPWFTPHFLHPISTGTVLPAAPSRKATVGSFTTVKTASPSRQQTTAKPCRPYSHYFRLCPNTHKYTQFS
jgi:hypothetical protein